MRAHREQRALVERPQLGAVRRAAACCRAAAGARAASAAASSVGVVDRRARAAASAPRRARRSARRPPPGPRRASPASASICAGKRQRERADGVREQDGVGLPVARRARRSTSVWAITWCSPKPVRVDRVAGEQRAERERVAVGLRAPRSAPTSRRAASLRRERRDRVGARRARALDRVAERVARARGQLGHGLRGRERRVADRRPRSARRGVRLVDALGVPVPARHLRARERRRDRHRARAAAERGGDRLGGVDHPPAAERDDAAVAARRAQPSAVAASSGDRPAGHERARAPAASATAGSAAAARSVVSSRSPGPPSDVDRLGRDAAAEADQALAVAPVEAQVAGARSGSYHESA